MVLVMVTVAALGVAILIISGTMRNEIEAYRQMKQMDLRNQLYLTLKAAAAESANLRLSASPAVPIPFRNDNAAFRSCMPNDPALTPFICPTTVNDPARPRFFHLYTVGGTVGGAVRIAGTPGRPKYYTLAGEPCSDATVVPGPDPAPSLIRNPDLPPPDCVLRAVARFVVECTALPNNDPDPLAAVAPFFGAGCELPGSEPSRLFTMISLDQEVGAMARAGTGMVGDRDAKIYRPIPPPLDPLDPYPYDFRLVLDGDDRPIVGNFVVDVDATEVDVANRAMPFAMWNIVDWDDVTLRFVNQVCPPGSVMSGIDRKGELICRCLLGSAADVPNQAEAGQGPASSLRCFVACPANQIMIGMDARGRATCVPIGTNRAGCSDPPISLGGIDGNRINCADDERLQTITGSNAECVVNGDDKVDCGPLAGICCKFVDR